MSDLRPPDLCPSEPHPRLVAVEGTSNFRDLGGYRGLGGRPLRWRRLFRSDHLGAVTPAGREVLAQLGVARALDFRGVHERAAAGYELPGLAQYNLAIEPTVVQRMDEITSAGRELTVAHVEGFMRDLYRGLVERNGARIRQFFDHLLEADAPVVFHCTAGKDRTGVAAALLLLALGVARETVMHDYLLTNECYRPPWVPRADIAPDVLRALWGVQADYLEAAFDALEREQGGTERYLRQQLGLDDERRAELVRRYLLPG